MMDDGVFGSVLQEGLPALSARFRAREQCLWKRRRNHQQRIPRTLPTISLHGFPLRRSRQTVLKNAEIPEEHPLREGQDSKAVSVKIAH